MTEEEWQILTNPRAVLTACSWTVSERKRRLMSLAACSLVVSSTEYDHLCALTTAEQFADKPDVTMSNSNAHKLSVRLFRQANNQTEAAIARAFATLFQGNTSAVLRNVLDVRGRSPQSDGSDEQLATLVRCIVGNPFRPVIFAPVWRSETGVSLASGIYAERAFDRLPILADALEEAGCDHTDALSHCRGPGPHARGCWVVDGVLGKS